MSVLDGVGVFGGEKRKTNIWWKRFGERIEAMDSRDAKKHETVIQLLKQNLKRFFP